MMLFDTSGLFCIFDVSEDRHSAAVAIFQNAAERITHNYVLADFVALCQARRLNRAATLAFLTDLCSNPEFQIVWVDSSLHEAAMRLLSVRGDKSYSLYDAVSFVIMREREIHRALTTDHHFEQEGFQRLLP